jgi:hypothetical protein
MFCVLVTLFWIAHASTSVSARRSSTPTLSMTRIVRPPAFPREIIVGRSRCGDVTWLLTTGLELINVGPTTPAAAARKVSGLAREDRPWGLACLEDRSLWALANPTTLVRLTTDGRTQERIPLTLPRASLFGVGDRVLFQQLPVAIGTEALMTSPPRQPAAARAWPGLLQRARASRAEEVARNLATCGLGAAGHLPCWFADETRIAVSDGRATRTIDARGLASRRPIAAIHDVALTPHGMWLLTRDRELGRPAATVLLFADGLSGATSVMDLEPAARIVLAASDASCLILTVHDEFAEVSVAR